MPKPKKGARAPDPRRRLPSVDALLNHPHTAPLVARHTRAVVLDALRAALAEMRAQGDTAPAATPDAVVDRAAAALDRGDRDRLRRAVNATGVLLHTGLGRAVLPPAAAQALGATMASCCNLQMDLATGRRGKRSASNEALLKRLTGAEAAVIVNNNAAATLLILAALCKDREVVVSRGQLIEIGGSFRLPDCVHQSGAKLVEVGTTNKTHLRDYEAALGPDTGAVMRVNPSNYRIIGFTKEVSVAELVTLRTRHPGLLVVDDLGAGSLLDLRPHGLPYEPTVQESVAAGADVVCFSGDKLIGGPQAGIIVGRAAVVDRIKKHPLTRMLRVCKLTELALQETLRLFLEPETLIQRHPGFRMLARTAAELEREAKELARRVDRAGVGAVPCESTVGGGSYPGHPLPSWGLSVKAEGLDADTLAARLRQRPVPVVPRIEEGVVLLDLRTLLPGEEEDVVQALQELL